MSKENTRSAVYNPATFFSIVNHPLKFKVFLLRKLPAAFFSGVRIVEADEYRCSVSIPYKWFTQNPFRSTYFACLAMAAEMSTGVLAMAAVYGRNPGVSMLVVGMESKFYKKAVGRTVFTCENGLAIRSAVERAIRSGGSETAQAMAAGYNVSNELVAEFWITWSFKAKNK